MITEKQREARRKRLGSSDIAALFNEDPWRNAWDLWAEKTGRVVHEEENDAMTVGTYIEDGVLKFAESQIGPMRRNQFRSHPELPIGANIDAITTLTALPVEAKTSGLMGPLREEWGEAGTSDVPTRVWLQAQTHMLCMAPLTPDICHVVALLGGRGFALFEVPWSQDAGDAISVMADHFWRNHVLADIAPDDFKPSIDTLKKIRRVPEKVVEIPLSAYELYQEAVALSKHAEERRSEAKRTLLTHLGDAEAGIFVDDEGNPHEQMLTYYMQSRKGYTVEPSEARVLRTRRRPDELTISKDGDKHVE